MISKNFETDYSYDDFLIRPSYSEIRSRFSETVSPYFEGKLPIVNAPMDTICSNKFIDATKSKLYAVFSHRFQSKEQQLEQIKRGASGAVIGLNDTLETCLEFCNAGATHILLDVASGGNIAVVEKLEELQSLRERVKLWAGNIGDYYSYIKIFHLCDFVRCGIGSGAACLTSVNTGVGRNSLSTIMEIVSHFGGKPRGAKLVADGGINSNGDICKAIVAGADLVMLGRMMAGVTEAKSEVVRGNYKRYRGLASEELQVGKTKYSVEGDSGLIPYLGDASYVLEQIESNIRSCMSYTNSYTLYELYENASFVKVSSSVANQAKSNLIKI